MAVPQVRARFLEFQPGQPMGNYHSHEESDGVETFVCLTGRFRFDIDGEAGGTRDLTVLDDRAYKEPTRSPSEGAGGLRCVEPTVVRPQLRSESLPSMWTPRTSRTSVSLSFSMEA